MSVKPSVRYMILCDNWSPDSEHMERVNIWGLLSSLDSLGDPPFPYRHPEFCVYLALTELRGSANAQIVCVFEETQQRTFATSVRPIAPADNPLDVVGIAFRIRGGLFPRSGIYSIQLWWDGELLDQRTISLR